MEKLQNVGLSSCTTVQFGCFSSSHSRREPDGLFSLHVQNRCLNKPHLTSSGGRSSEWVCYVLFPSPTETWRHTWGTNVPQLYLPLPFISPGCSSCMLTQLTLQSKDVRRREGNKRKPFNMINQLHEYAALITGRRANTELNVTMSPSVHRESNIYPDDSARLTAVERHPAERHKQQEIQQNAALPSVHRKHPEVLTVLR